MLRALRQRSRRTVLATAGLALGLAGCAELKRTPTTTSKLAQAQTTHEYPSPSPAPEAVSGGSASQRQALRAFATGYINWSAADVTQEMRRLAAQSIGQARSAMELAAAQTAGDYELRQGGIANSGVVEAIAPLAGEALRFVIVTRESTTATNTTQYQGLRPAWHIALGTVTQLGPGRWAVSGWQPEN